MTKHNYYQSLRDIKQKTRMTRKIHIAYQVLALVIDLNQFSTKGNYYLFSICEALIADVFLFYPKPQSLLENGLSATL